MDKRGIQFLKKDPALKKIIATVPIQPLEQERDVFQDLIRSIIGQQLSVKAAATIYNRFKKLFSQNKITPRKVIKKNESDLRSAGLSRAKAIYVKEVAHFSLKHKFDIAEWRNMNNEQALSLLTSIKGVGIWTAQMILIFSMHRPDVFPTKDVGIQNAMKKLFSWKAEGKSLEKIMIKTSNAWQPHRSLACRLLWSYLDNPPD